MKAIGYKENLPIENVNSLQDIKLETPKATGKDILVEIKAISVNPADYKVRAGMPVQGDDWKVIGWDATGVVKEVGEDATLFKVGDEVWYAGDFTRQGSYAQFQVVDERIVGKKPASLSYAEAAALPLTSLTAWEMLFDRLEVAKNDASKSILVIGAAGGVGSILVQLAKKLTQLNIIATASREETTAWLKELGADTVINHRNKLSEEFEKYDLPAPEYVVSLNATEQHVEEIAKLIKPQGKFGFIDDPKSLNVMPFKGKAVSTHIELMFTRSMFQTEDMVEQHNILNEVSELIDNGTIRTTLGEHFGTINAENLRKAHAFLETGKAKGKIVLEGF
ncbi:zinc-binding alcohol dehydrogenase family protein [Zobellia galactanivorans]|uniref:zinc-binding alcohol dehydrogenase family protein n=1 Tax=Zobellia galactanivorans (strain DSM 12802 / CCUG 47099 / CIP 106680 / NCIMB 13871 / Dsij) TaxID=63186 RepID=UPI001C07D63D|nr:zinc-binding alcohol dehydrogenase family protein [Zobellia galactanivorans]MBU3024926.1 zinc-binding alcohol dehydrogenase family protein [Zobellia galactanivorans]MDO6808776.1 zinc-binding alcohol dehydrogenase family protein [Zobellia galactanivorans]